MIPLKDYLFRAPDSNIEFYVDTKKICQIILNLASQYGPNKAIATNYLKKYDNLIPIRLPTIFPDILSEYTACNYLFREILNEEIEKVNKFSITKHEEIYREIMRIGKLIRSDISIPIEEFLKDYKRKQNITNEFFNINKNFVCEYEKLLKDMESSLIHLSNEIIHLDFYIRTNFKILTRLCRFFDVMLQSSTSVWFQTQLTKEPFVDVNIDILMILLSLSWTRYREAEKIISNIIELKERRLNVGIDIFCDKNGNTSKKWKPPETFLRSTTKYWVHPNNVVSAKVGIIRYIPYLIFGVSNEELETLLDPYLCVEGHDVIDPKTIEESQAITSVYLDNESTECFYNRISRFEKAQLFRLRWYGSNSGSKDKEIFVERKTHHEGWTGEKSTKERFSLPQKYIFNYLKGNITIEDLINKGIFNNKKFGNSDFEKTINFAKEVQEYIVYNRLQPFVRTSYLRAAFQNQDNNQVRFSIDTNLCMVNEFIPNGHKNEPWCRLAEEVLSKNEVTRFPYAILEVKLQSEQPNWVSEVLKRCNATLVYKFSKFQHGMAILHENKVPIFPHWIEEFHRNNHFISSKSISELNDENDSDFTDNHFYVNKRNFYNDVLNTNRLSDMIVNSKDINSSNIDNTNINDNKIILLIDKLMNSYLNMTAFDLHGLQIQWNRTVDEIEFSNISIDDNYNDANINTKKIKKLDPKSLFAAERVLLYWVRKSVYISTFVILLLSSSNKKKNISKYCFFRKYINYIEYSFIPLIIFTLIYGIYVYNARCKTIEKRMVRSLEHEKERIDYPKSSLIIFTILCSIIIFSLLLNIINKSNL